MTEVGDIARGLSEAQVQTLLDAQLADSCEWWVGEDLGDPRLASDDYVLTELGLAVRAHLQGTPHVS